MCGFSVKGGGQRMYKKGLISLNAVRAAIATKRTGSLGGKVRVVGW